jgi:hypothetical protein
MIDLRGIVSISGQSGLYKVISKTKYGLIVESIADGKRMPAYAHQRISALEDISVFTTGEDLPLAEVFQKIFDKEKGNAINFDLKADKEDLFKIFENYLPEFDKERVYASDIKKIFSWYNLLQSKNLLKELKEEITETSTAENKEAEEKEKEKEKEKPKSKKSTKTKEEKEEAKAPKAKAEKKQAATKKTTKKSTKEEGDEKPASKAKKTSSKKADK